MVSHLLFHFLLLVFLTGKDFVLVKATEHTIACGFDTCCQAMAKLMTAVNEINNKLDEKATCAGANEKVDRQAKDLEEVNDMLDRSLASTAAISKQMERLSADLLSHGERLKAHTETPGSAGSADKLLQGKSTVIKYVLKLPVYD